MWWWALLAGCGPAYVAFPAFDTDVGDTGRSGRATPQLSGQQWRCVEEDRVFFARLDATRDSDSAIADLITPAGAEWHPVQTDLVADAPGTVQYTVGPLTHISPDVGWSPGSTSHLDCAALQDSRLWIRLYDRSSLTACAQWMPANAERLEGGDAEAQATGGCLTQVWAIDTGAPAPRRP